MTQTQHTTAEQIKQLIRMLYPDKDAMELCSEQTSLFDYPLSWVCRINIEHGLGLLTLIDILCRCKISTRAVRVDTNQNGCLCICITNFKGEHVDYTDEAREEMENEK